MYGIYIEGRRPKSKKEVKEGIGIKAISLEATSIFGNETSGYLEDLPDGTYTFVGPDPYTSRKFYGNIVKSAKGVKVT